LCPFDSRTIILIFAVIVLASTLIIFPGTSQSEETDGADVEDVQPAPVLPGDIDGSGVVDRNDRRLMESSLGATPEDHDWDIRCDLDHDDFVGFKDFAILKENMGKRLSGGRIVQGIPGDKCPHPKLRFAPLLEMTVAYPEELSQSKVWLVIGIDKTGDVISARPAFSELGPNQTKTLAFLAKNWYFEPAVNDEDEAFASLCIVPLDLASLCEIDGGQLPE